MSRRDKYHYNVKKALEKEDWNVTDDPYVLSLKNEQGKNKSYSIDLGAEKLLGARKGNQKIAVEVKTFGGSSVMNDYHRALGQYMDYLAGLEVLEPERKLYLAISEKAYQEILLNPLAKLSLIRYKIRLIIFNPTTNTIIKWKE